MCSTSCRSSAGRSQMRAFENVLCQPRTFSPGSTAAFGRAKEAPRQARGFSPRIWMLARSIAKLFRATSTWTYSELNYAEGRHAYRHSPKPLRRNRQPNCGGWREPLRRRCDCLARGFRRRPSGHGCRGGSCNARARRLRDCHTAPTSGFSYWFLFRFSILFEEGFLKGE